MSINCILITFCFPFSVLFWFGFFFSLNPPTTGKGSRETMGSFCEAECCTGKHSNGSPPLPAAWPARQNTLSPVSLQLVITLPANSRTSCHLNIKLSSVLALVLITERVGGREEKTSTNRSTRVQSHTRLFNSTRVISHTRVSSLFAVAAGSFSLRHSKKGKVS